MSGTGASPNLVSINLDTVPREGSKVCVLSVSWARQTAMHSAGIAHINLLQQFQTGAFTGTQSVYIDNTTVAYTVVLTADETGQAVTVPAFSQGTFTVLCGYTPSFTLTQIASQSSYFNGTLFATITQGTTRLHFLNVPRPEFLRIAPAVPTYASGDFGLCSLANVNPGLRLKVISSPVTMLAATTGGLFYRLLSVSIDLQQVGSYPAATNLNFRLETPNAPVMGFGLLCTTGVSVGGYRQTFDTPMLIPYASGLQLSCGTPNPPAAAPSVGGPLSGGNGYIAVDYTLIYDTVTVA